MSQTTPPPASAVRKLRVGATFAESHSFVFNRLDLLLKAATVPYLITMVLTVFSLMAQPNAGFVYLITILFFVPYTWFGVAWHRLTLLGPRVSPPRVAAAWKRRHWRFLGYAVAVTAIGTCLWIGVTLLIVLLALPMSESGMFASESPKLYIFIAITVVIGGIGFLYLIMRFSFVFPAVAVEETYRLRHAWTHTRGQGFRLIGLMILTALPIYLASWLLTMILDFFVFENMNMQIIMGNFPEGTTIGDFVAENFVPLTILHAISNVLNYLLTAVIVSAISIAFRTCTGWVPDVGGLGTNTTGSSDR